MAGFVVFMLRNNLQKPVTAMISAIADSERIEPTGVEEFDKIGHTINDTMSRLRERTVMLEQELVERKRAEDEVVRREEHIRMLLSSTAEGIYGVNNEGNCTFCNPACLRMLGYEREDQLINKNLHDVIHHSYPDGRRYPEDECRVYKAYRAGKGIHVDDEVFWRSDGSSFPVEYWSYPVIEGGEVTGTVVTFIDITERLRSVNTILEEKNKFETIITAMGDGVSIQDRSFRILYQNDVHKNLVGSHANEYCYQAYQSRDDVCNGCPVALAFSDGRIHTTERTVEQAGGTKTVEVTASPLRDASGTIVAGIEVVRDITERRKAEDHLRQSQKMESVGQLAGGLAHDFNNVLTAIMGYASLIEGRLDENDPLRKFTREINAAAQRGGMITQQILAFSRKQPVTVRPVNLNQIISDIKDLLLRLIREDIQIDLHLFDQPLVILADAGQIDQILINLATNARDAMPDGGTLTIRTEQKILDESFVMNHGYGRPGEYALLTVSDTGTGMDSQVMQRIFDPFFTTKTVGAGTGLGLSIVYGIVAKHNGYITVYSEPGQGSVFRIYLPLEKTDKKTVPENRAADLDASTRGSETILVAEDDESLRKLSRTVLQNAGYTIIEAVDGEDAVRKFTENKGSIDIVLLDGIMPRKNGKETCREMKAIRPDLKVIFVSGYAENIFSAAELEELGAAFLPKPVYPKDLLKTIRSVLDS